MFLWNKQSLKWMKDAADYTDYFSILANQVIDIVTKESTVCEIGCGMGYLSFKLAEMAKEVYSVDVSKEALDFMKKEKEKRKLQNIQIINDDWRNTLEYTDHKKFDLTIYSNFSGITTDWEKLTEMTEKYIVAVLPRHHSHSHSQRETVTKALLFLNSNKISYKYIRHDIQFGQPFYEEKDIQEYLEHYNSNSDNHVKKIMKHPLTKGGFYYLDKMKKGGTIIIKLN